MPEFVDPEDPADPILRLDPEALEIAPRSYSPRRIFGALREVPSDAEVSLGVRDCHGSFTARSGDFEIALDDACAGLPLTIWVDVRDYELWHSPEFTDVSHIELAWQGIRKARVLGRVLDDAGDVVPGARVSVISCAEMVPIYTNELGEFRFPSVAKVCVDRLGAELGLRVDASAGRSASVVAVVGQPIDIVLAARATILSVDPERSDTCALTLSASRELSDVALGLPLGLLVRGDDSWLGWGEVCDMEVGEEVSIRSVDVDEIEKVLKAAGLARFLPLHAAGFRGGQKLQRHMTSVAVLQIEELLEDQRCDTAPAEADALVDKMTKAQVPLPPALVKRVSDRVSACR
jgi:hypothetical protein